MEKTKRKKMQCKDVADAALLEFLYPLQGQWTLWSDWYGRPGMKQAFPSGTPRKLMLAKMKKLVDRRLVSGCACGCRGDFEITDKGLALLGKPRLKIYTGYI